MLALALPNFENSIPPRNLFNFRPLQGKATIGYYFISKNCQ
jgi:hypothetical protein